MVPKAVSVTIEELEVNLFVRNALDSDRVIALAELIESGVRLDPIKITRDNKVIDGRHRIEAFLFLDHKEIEAEIMSIGSSDSELIAEAYKANTGGPLPPTQADTEHTVSLLLEKGETQKRIAELLGFPPALARRYINEIRSKVARAKLQRAAAAVTEGGLTVAKAAEQYAVEPEKLKDTLSGGKRKRKETGISEIQRNLTKLYKSLGLRNAAMIRNLLEKLEDADVTEDQVKEVFRHYEKLQRRHTRTISGWKERFEEKVRTQERLAAS